MSLPDLELRLFGAPQLRRDGRALHIGARKALAVLAVLAVDGRASRKGLAALLWPELERKAAMRNLRQELFRLRKFGVVPMALADQCLALPLRFAVDVVRFRELLAGGNDAGALALPAARVGDGLDGVAGDEFDAWLERTRARFVRERALARARHAEKLESDGELGAALALQQEALVDDGCAETAARAAMRLQVALGQRAEAAALYQRLQQVLRDELDIAPAEQTRSLARSLQIALAEPPPTDEQRAGPRPAAPAWLPDRVPFVGRGDERRRIDAAIAARKRVYLSGVAGSGKTRLASECSAARGAWLRVACAPTDPGLPYASATRVIRALREAAPGVELPAWVRREMAWLLPELGEGPPPVGGAEAGERLRTAFAAAWQTLATASFDTIVLDDWHWADDASVDLWQRVEERAAASIVVYRSAQLGTAALARMRAEVDRDAAVSIEIDGLAPEESLALIRALSSASGGALFARRLHGATAGNPFHLIETLRHLAEQGQLRRLPDGRWSTPFDDTTTDYAELPVPASVRDVVLGRVRALGDPTWRLLEAASLLGDHIDVNLLEGTCALDADARIRRLEHAQAARLLAADGTGFRFAHDLIRHCLSASLSAPRRRHLHGRLARRLADCAADPARVAAHYEAAGEPGSAIGWRRRAAEQAWRAHASAEAGSHYRQALADGARGGDAVSIRLALAEIERHRGDAAALMETLQAAVHAARDTDTETQLGARLFQLKHWVTVDRNAAVLAALDALAADLATASAALRARALQLRALVHRFEGRHEQARRLDDEAIALLEGLPQAQALRAELLDAAARTALAGNQLARGEALAERAVAAADSAGDDVALSRALVARGIGALFARNDRATAAAAFERARALAQRMGHVPQHRAAILNLVKLHGDAGRVDDAIALLDEGEALAPGFEHVRAELAFFEARYFMHYLRGDVDAARAGAERLIAAASRVGDQQIRQSSYQLVVDLYLHTGDFAAAERLLDEAGDSGAGVQRTVLTAKRAWLQWACGRPQAALDLLATLDEDVRAEDRLIIAWVGAASALALDDDEGARTRLAAVDIGQDHVVDALAMVLVQRLHLARRTGAGDASARARALELLPRTPALEAALLRQALA